MDRVNSTTVVRAAVHKQYRNIWCKKLPWSVDEATFRESARGLLCRNVAMGNTKKPEIRHQSRRDFATVGSRSTAINRNAARKVTKQTSRRKEKGGSSGSGGVPPWIRWSAVLGILGAICAVVGYWGLVFYFETRLPEVFAPEDYEARTQQVSRIFSEDGRVLLELGEERRTIVPAKQLPKIIKYAVLAAEDADFYEHDGLDYWGMARAMYKNLRDQRYSQGASTITQQVAKTFYLSTEKTIARKLKEVVLARQLEQKLSKDDILYLYLNQIYWGHGRYGVYEAARHYFAKKPSALSLAQAALLSGLIAAPERYTPFRNFAKAKERQAFVLDQMVSRGWIPKKRAEKAKRENVKAQLNIKHTNDRFIGVGAYATEAVRKQLKEELGSDRLKRGGLRIFTSLDARMQVHAERAVRNGLRNNLDRNYRFARPIARKGKKGVQRFIKRLTRRIPKRGVRSGEIVSGIVMSVDVKQKAYVVNFGMGPALMPFAHVERYSKSVPRRKARTLYAVGDVLRVSPKLDAPQPWGADDSRPQVNLEQGPQAALVAIAPRSRRIKALVGGYDFKSHPFNRAIQAKRQAGSTFKPLVYAAGMETGRIDPLTRVRNVPESYRMGPGRYWKPRNFGGTYDGKNYTLRQALAQSINIVAVKVLEKFVGVLQIIFYFYLIKHLIKLCQ